VAALLAACTGGGESGRGSHPPTAPSEQSPAPAAHVALRHVAFNLAFPPFDDVHVRRAVVWVLDRARLARITGRGKPATHIVPDPLEDGRLAHFDPFRTSGRHGDIRRARAEMRLSRYDTNKDGRCYDALCAGFLLGTPLTLTPRGVKLTLLFADAVAPLGLRPDIRGQPSPPRACLSQIYGVCLGAERRVQRGDASTFLVPMVTRSGLWLPPGTHLSRNPPWPPPPPNLSLLGAGRSFLRKLGLNGRFVSVPPNVAPDVRACKALDPTQQTRCWAVLDRKMTAKIVAVIPYLFEPTS
jgi:hypothetical protein